MKYFLLLFAIALGSISLKAQTAYGDMKSLKDIPLYFVDSIPVLKSDLDRINPEDIANIVVYKGERALRVKGNTQNKNNVVFIETKKFVQKKYWQFLSSRSEEYRKIVPAPGDDKFVQYIMNGKLIKSDLLLSELNEKSFISLEIIPKDTLLKKYGIYRMNYGVELKISENQQN